jgi:ribosomal protein L9
VFRRLFLLPNFVAAQQTYNHNSKLELRKEKKERAKKLNKTQIVCQDQQQL